MVRAAGILPYRFLPADSGGRKGIAFFYRYFSRQIPVTCITTQNNGCDELGQYRQERLLSASASRYANPFYFFRIRKLLKEQQATHLILEHPYYGWLAVWLQKATGVKLVVHSHNIEGERFKHLGKPWWRILASYERWVHRQADYNFFITDEDRRYAIERFRLNASKCTTITYGIELEQAPSLTERAAAAQQLKARYQLPQETHLFLFNGFFDYKPNADALNLLVDDVYPRLLAAGIPFRLLICGRHIPAHITSERYSHIIPAGFVDDMELYLKGTDLFLSPISDGGGIKTKLVEALATNTTCVSFANGAIGVPAEIAGNKLHIASQVTAEAFTTATLQALPSAQEAIPEAFFDHFNWNKIAEKAAGFIGG